jgi:hypothetical protein
MEKRDMRAERRALWAEDGFAEAPEIALRIFDDQEQSGVRRQPPCRSRHPQPERWHRRGHRDQLLQVRRLIDHRDVRLDRRGGLRIPAMAQLVDALAQRAGQLRDRDAARGRGVVQVGVCASVSAR